MFRSSRRAVVYPQAEHARLSAAIALAWGNEAFERPPVPFDAFVRGVALHDRGYGQLDNDGISEVEPERWLAIQRAGFEPRGAEPLVDLLVALHVRRLVAKPRSALELDALREMDAALPALHSSAGVSEADAARADRITDLCDRIAFDFCFEVAASGSVEVAPRADAEIRAPVAYAVDGLGRITLTPWPLAVPRATGLIFAYASEGYPDVLEPVVVPFEIAPH